MLTKLSSDIQEAEVQCGPTMDFQMTLTINKADLGTWFFKRKSI